MFYVPCDTALQPKFRHVTYFRCGQVHPGPPGMAKPYTPHQVFADDFGRDVDSYRAQLRFGFETAFELVAPCFENADALSFWFPLFYYRQVIY